MTTGVSVGSVSVVLGRARHVLGGAVRLLARAAFPLLRTILAGLGLCVVLMVPVWIWLNASVRLVGLEDLDHLTTAEAVKAVLVVAIPAVLVVFAGALATLGGMMIVVDDVRAGRRPRAVRAVGVGLRSVPRLASSLVPAVLAILALFVLAPVIVVVGLVLAPITYVGRRVRPERRWPSWRTVITMIVPFGALAVVAARWSVLPAVVLLERTGPRSAFARSRALTKSHTIDVAIVLVFVSLVLVAVLAAADALLSAAEVGQTGQDLATVGFQAALLVLLVGLAVWLFADQGGVAVTPPAPAPPRVQLAVVVAFALVAVQVPLLVGTTRADAAAPGSTLVVNDLGDADDANAGDGTCATAAGVCTLRAAVQEANATEAAQDPDLVVEATIGFDVSGTITVAAEITMLQPMAIDGSGSDITVSGGGTATVFFIQIEKGGATIRNLTIADGLASGTGGGAVLNNSAPGGSLLENVTIRNNTAPSGVLFGGAVTNTSLLTIVDSTFSGNSAATVDGSDVMSIFAGNTTIRSSTFVGATGPSAVAAVNGGALTIENSIIAGADMPCSASGSSIDGANNISVASGVPACPGIATPLAALALQPLADNGGDTDTVRLGPTSIAIDAGDDATCPSTDQRGVLRTKGDACDVGAYEFDPSTTTSLASTPNPSTPGAAVVLDAAVVAVEPDTPSGSVEFFDGATSLGSQPLGGGGFASLSVPSLSVGSHTITATYAPDGGYDPSTSTAVTHVVNKAATTVQLTSSASATVGGAPVTFTIEVTGGMTPTGSVTLLDGAATLATPTLDGTGKATFTTSALAGGHHTLTATYAGDSGHTGNTSAALGHDIVGASTVTVTGPASSTVFGNAAAFDVQVSSAGGGATPTGSVSLYQGATFLTSGTLDGLGRATLTTSALLPGVQALTASYGGDSFNGASSGFVSHTVAAAATSTSLTLTPSGSSVFGNTVTMTATVAAPTTSVKPTGTVTFWDGVNSYGPEPLDAATGTVTFPVTSFAMGSHLLQAVFTPDTGFATSSSAAVTHAVVAATTAVALTSSASSTVSGQSVTLSATVSATNAPLTPTGTVTFHDGAAVLGTGNLDGTGQASLATTAIAVGSRTLTATYEGAPGFATSTSPGLAQTVAKAQVSVSLTDTPDPSVSHQSVAFAVRVQAVAPGSGIPAGTVALKEGATVLSTLTLDGTGRATANLSSLAVGSHTLTAQYAGNARFAVGSATAAHTVSADTASVALTSSAPTTTFTQSVTFTATVTGTGSAIPSGSVTFKDGATTLGTSSLDAGGVASLTRSTLRAGTYPVTAEYGGNADFSSAVGSVSQTVQPAGTATSLVVAPMTPTVDDLVTLTATVAGTTTAVKPAGSIAFYDGATVLATVPVAADGTAKHEQTFTRAVHALTAKFVGASGWSNSDSSATSITPARASVVMGLVAAPTSVVVGGSVTLTATMTLSPIGPAPTGSIRFWSGSTFLGSGTITGGVATLTHAAPTAVGPWAVSATYDGDANHEQGATPDVPVQVTAAPTSTTSAVPATTYVGDTFVVGAQVTSAFSGSTITGQVRFTSDAPGFTTLTANVDSSGFAQTTSSPIAVGSWTVTATYEPSPSSVFATSSSTQTIVSQRRSTSVTLSAPSTATLGSTFAVSFAVADVSGTGPSRTGTVTVSGGGTSCTSTVSAGQCSLKLTTGGSIPLTATYSGDSAYEGATSNTVTVHTQGGTPTLRAFTTTSTWATGDPIGIGWQLTGPSSGEIVVRTPFGEACRVVTTGFGSCTVTFPFAQRGQSIPIDVVYAGDASWQPATATVTQTVMGCYPVIFEVIPAGTGTIGHTAGNCNGGAGFLGGTTVGAAVEPIGAYQLDHWLETGSTARAISFVVGDGSSSATALMTVDCVAVTVAAAEQIDLGDLRSRGGTVAFSTPNCPGRPAVVTDPSTGASVGWYVPETSVTLTGQPRRPATDELKGWYQDPVLTRTDGPLTIVASQDTYIEARFGVQCVSPTFASLGGGTVEAFTDANCIDSNNDWSWQKGSRVGAHVVPDAYHWIDSYGDTPPADEIVTPYRVPGTPISTESANAFWDVTSSDQTFEVSFETCRELTTEAVGPGTIEVITASNCRTRPITDGRWYEPDTRVELRAVPGPTRNRSYRLAAPDGTLFEDTVTVVPKFRDWTGVDQAGVLVPSLGDTDATRGIVWMDDSSNVKATFYDNGECVALNMATMPATLTGADGQPAPAGALSVDLTYDDGTCPAGQYSQGGDHIGDLATFRASDVPARNALVGWKVNTSEGNGSAERFVENNAPDTPIEWSTDATAYVCRGITPLVDLDSPYDGGDVSNEAAPPDSTFVIADTEPNCPLWENTFQIGTTVTLEAGAPEPGYEFLGWTLNGEEVLPAKYDLIQVRMTPDGYEYRRAPVVDDNGQVVETNPPPFQKVKFSNYVGGLPTQSLGVKASYRLHCTVIQVTVPSGVDVSVGPEGNCPGASESGRSPNGQTAEFNGQKSLTYEVIAGTPMLVGASRLENHDFNTWTAKETDGYGNVYENAPTEDVVLNDDEAVAALRAEGIDDLADIVETMDNPAMVNADKSYNLEAIYDEHSAGKQLGDSIAVGFKRLLGFAATYLLGKFESATGLGGIRLLLALTKVIAKAINPQDNLVKGIDLITAHLDLLEAPLTCVGDWSKGAERPPPVDNPLAKPPPEVPVDTGPSKTEVVMRSSYKSTTKVVQSTVERSLRKQLQRLGKVPTNETFQQFKLLQGYTKSVKLLGKAASYGSQLYYSFVDGPGASYYNDTAEEAFGSVGNKAYTDCLSNALADATKTVGGS